VRVAQDDSDYFKNAVDISDHLVVPKAKHFEAMLDEPTVADCVTLVGGVLAAIDFDDEPCFAAQEVDDVRTDRLLPDKFMSIESA
jgi:hypothetical protein